MKKRTNRGVEQRAGEDSIYKLPKPEEVMRSPITDSASFALRAYAMSTEEIVDGEPYELVPLPPKLRKKPATENRR